VSTSWSSSSSSWSTSTIRDPTHRHGAWEGWERERGVMNESSLVKRVRVGRREVGRSLGRSVDHVDGSTARVLDLATCAVCFHIYTTPNDDDARVFSSTSPRRSSFVLVNTREASSKRAHRIRRRANGSIRLDRSIDRVRPWNRTRARTHARAFARVGRHAPVRANARKRSRERARERERRARWI